MKVAIRADASRRIGSGHVARCVRLGSELLRRGARVLFIARDHEDGWYDRVAEAGLDLNLMPRPRVGACAVDESDYTGWLGVDVDEDADETLARLGDDLWDLVVVDHYALGQRWEQRLRRRAKRLMAIDDLADRRHDVDVLLDQNLRSDGGAAYRYLVPEHATILSGPGYALLDPGFQRARSQREVLTEPGRVLVSLGSVADAELLREIAGSLLPAANEAQVVDIIDPLGSLQGWMPTEQQVACSVHAAQPDLIDFMLRAEVAVGAGGVTTWERACLGLPSVTISLADNQRSVLHELAEVGAIVYLGDASVEAARDCGRAVSGLLADRQRCEAMSRLGRTLVDGRGLERVAEAIFPQTRSLALRPASYRDAGMLWLLANSTDVRRQAVSSASIPWTGHVQWFEDRLAGPDTDIFVLEMDGLPVGQIRFDINDRTATVNYAIDASVRGRGWGAALVKMGIERLSEQRAGRPETVVAHVKTENEPSLRVFARLGFGRADEHPEDGLVVFEKPLPSNLADDGSEGA